MLIGEISDRLVWYLIGIGLSVAQFVLNLYLLLVSRQKSISSCSWPPWDLPGSASSTPRMLLRPSQWQKYALLLCSSLLLDFLVVSAFGFPLQITR